MPSVQELDRSMVDLDDILAVVPQNEETAPLTEQAVSLRDEAHRVIQVSEGVVCVCERERESERKSSSFPMSLLPFLPSCSSPPLKFPLLPIPLLSPLFYPVPISFPSPLPSLPILSSLPSQLASQLYSQDAEVQQTEAVISQLRQVVATLQTKLFEEHVQVSLTCAL